MPAKAGEFLEGASEVLQREAGRARDKALSLTPEPVKDAGDFVADAALAPTLKAVVSLLDWTAEVVSEFSSPEAVFKHHRSKGHDIRVLSDLRGLDLKDLDQFTRRMSLTWRGIGALEGAALGAMAFIPGPGTLASITLDVVVSNALTSAIATRVAYSYGFDARDPEQADFIARMVRRQYVAVATRASTTHRAWRAFDVARDRKRWSKRLRQDEKLLAAMEKLMQQFTKAPVPVQKAAKTMPLVAVFTGAGLNQHMLGDVAKQARLYAATVFLAEKHGLPMPERLRDRDD